MPEHFDVLIVGAGISGIAAAYHLQDQLPDASFAILESQNGFGGTWKTHRYPGIRSDSDLYTFGYRFKPWVGPPIASGTEIMRYLEEVIEENDIAQHIRYRHHVQAARWSSDDNLWTLSATNLDTGETREFTAGFLWMCQGYYRHDKGYTPNWDGMADFGGQIIHPQNWPEDFDTSDKRVVVIGSGATAATIVPAMAGKCAHVTMLQRSPTYFFIRPNVHELAQALREIEIDEDVIHPIVRKRILFDQNAFIQRCAAEPEEVRQELLALVRAHAGEKVDIEKHFSPGYRPWRQRLALVPDGDLFQAIRDGHASVITDEIERFTDSGIQLKSGDKIEADIIVTATGFNLNVLGDIDFIIDGAPLDFHETLTYRGMMFTGMPNMVWVFGYFRASWTLRSELIADFVCRLLTHMKAKGAKRVEPMLRAAEQDMTLGPWMDPKDFNPGYLMRGMHLLPKRGTTRDWQHTQDYWHEKDEFPQIDLTDEVFVYDGNRASA
ncbi:NAD(P)-binding protein [Sulfitobacter sp. JBTF-M27]|uniref:NAD(P)-binding protein n=1 Tax=Sulfitobacter sediminilitoris TaxID=2698830 RepID=A0A6P0CF86_9RHOB|nr:NAD(P)/FAD-dependent oxidoreductase [Sulfitobacter sediminilitoris]NEK23888.1 NAD(P)-binding protein [Sulfitobacter sediminilitoris]